MSIVKYLILQHRCVWFFSIKIFAVLKKTEKIQKFKKIKQSVSTFLKFTWKVLAGLRTSSLYKQEIFFKMQNKNLKNYRTYKIR